MDTKKKDNLQEYAIKCVLEEHYMTSKDNLKKLPNILIENKSVYFKTPLGKISDNCPFCKGKIADTILIESLPKMKILDKIKLIRLDKNRDKRSFNGEVWSFSPLFFTERKIFFAILSEKSNYESQEVFIHLIQRKNNGHFEYLLPINGYIVFY